MPVRVRIRIKPLKGTKVGDVVESTALLNTGYTGSSNEIMIPVRLSEIIGLWPPPMDAVESTYETAGGPARFFVVKKGAGLMVIEESDTPRELVVDIVVSPMEREVLLSDVVISGLEMIILDAYKGHWRFRSDPEDRVRRSARPELW